MTREELFEKLQKLRFDRFNYTDSFTMFDEKNKDGDLLHYDDIEFLLNQFFDSED